MHLFITNHDDFNRTFPDEEKCLEYLRKLRFSENSHTCLNPKCGSTEFRRVKRNYSYECKKCGRQKSVLAGTLFQDTHKPLRLWFEAIRLIVLDIKTNKRTTASEIKEKLAPISPRTVWIWLNKLWRMMAFIGSKERLSGKIKIGRAYIKIPQLQNGRRKIKNKHVAIAMELPPKPKRRIRVAILANDNEDSLKTFIQNTKEKSATYEIDNDFGYLNDITLSEIIKWGNPKLAKDASLKNTISSIEKWFEKISVNANFRTHLPCYLDEYSFCHNYGKTMSEEKLFAFLMENALRLNPTVYLNTENN